jgi:predicted  nucleic acid-binding Zn ribbon protein
MYKVTITYVLKKRADAEAINKVWSIVAAYLRAGQLVGDQWVTLGGRPNIIRATGVAHEQSAFSPRFVSPEARSYLKELAPFLRGTPKMEWEQFAEDSKTCRCAKPPGFIFAPEVWNGASPLQCLKCRGRCPMYLVVPRSDRGELRSLSRQWVGFYWTWMDSGATEALAWNQLADPESEFSRMAREELKGLEKEIRLPIYHDLLTKYASRADDPPEETTCPGCGRSWDEYLVDGRALCVNCRLSYYNPDDRDAPDWWKPLPRHRRRKTRR